MTDGTPKPSSDGDSVSGLTLAAFYERNGVSPGADFFLVGPGSIARSGEQAAVLIALRENDAPIVSEVVIVLPPGQAEADARPLVEDAFRRQVAEFTEGRIRAEQIRLPSSVRFEAMDSFDASALLRRLRDARHPAAFVVPRAAYYHQLAVSPDGSAAPEDLWVRELHALGVAVVATVAPLGSYVVLDADEWWPEREWCRELLLSVEHCGVANVTDPSIALAARVDRWMQLARDGELDTALGEIGRQADLSVAQRIFARMSAFNEAGYPIETIAEFTRERDAIEAQTGEEALVLAHAALRARRPDLARTVLARAIPDLNHPNALQTALRLADALDDTSLIADAEAILRKRHPKAPLLVERAVGKLLAEDRRLAAAERLESVGGADFLHEAGYLRWLDAELDVHPLDPAGLLAACEASFPDEVDRTLRSVASRLERDGHLAEALDVLLAITGEDGLLDRADVWSALSMLERGILKANKACTGERSAVVVGAAVQWLSRNPLDVTIRSKIADLLSPQMIGGSSSTAVIVQVCDRFSRQQLPLRPSASVEGRPKPCDVRELSSILTTGLAHVARLPQPVLGRVRFPPEALSVPADAAIAGFVEVLGRADFTDGEGLDAEAVESCLAVATSLVSLGTQPDADLLLIRTAGGRLALHGMAQSARDLAEHVLNVAGTDPHRIRVAWYSYADLYHRSGDMIEAFLGLACALAVPDALDVDQAWYECHLIIRLFRDVGLHALLPPLVRSARVALADGGLPPRCSLWLDTIDLQSRLLALDRLNPDRVELTALVADTAANLRAIVREDDDVGPAMMLLASLARIAREADIPVGGDVETMIDEVQGRLGPTMRILLAVSTKAAPDAEDLARLATAIRSARYADDVGFDLRHLVIGAKRLLSSATTDPVTAAFAIEVMSDLGLPMPGGSTTKPPTSIEAPARYAKEIAKEGIAVVMLGLSDRGLVRVTFPADSDGAAPETFTLEDRDVFSDDAFRQWRAIYPHAYQDPKRDTSHDFFVSTQHLGLSGLPRRAVIVADTDLQAFPPNLFQIERELAGQQHGLALAPSLTWLRDARRTPFAGDGALRAWIPDADPLEGNPTLSVLADRLGSSFTRHGVQLFNGEEPPPILSRSEMVIIGAHGGVGERKRYFRALADDADLVLASSAVSASLGEIGVVVLFVCSGGRIDKHPGASTTVGLAKQLLANGCRAVVAPPWPLNTSVPPAWLDTFLDLWTQGRQVLDACFAANAAVRAKRGDEPSADLAMTVYGDPFMTRPRR